MRYEMLMDSPIEDGDDDDDDEEDDESEEDDDGDDSEGGDDQESEEEDDDECDSEDESDDGEDDAPAARRRNTKRKRQEDGTGSFKYAFRTFLPKLGLGIASKFKRRKTLYSPVPSLKRLENFDRSIEMYFRYELPGMSKCRLCPTVREKDDKRAWDVRVELLSPRTLFGSSRRKDYTEELTRELCDDDDKDVVGGEGIMDLDELMEVDRGALSPEMAKSLELIDPRAIIRDPEGRRISFRHMLAWNMESYMFKPDYFLRRSFPSCEAAEIS
ncbi:uncharacterized protein LOC117099874 [Anneissia japonica]|uniref:uncharacterized protein LOC117099874 n=1 Tax=Anneissia japonica TaxID=1529436 RepID=UPI0014258EB1|nr:uncharacterized protein LOC117099874 [Anneissia japonica]